MLVFVRQFNALALAATADRHDPHHLCEHKLLHIQLHVQCIPHHCLLLCLLAAFQVQSYCQRFRPGFTTARIQVAAGSSTSHNVCNNDMTRPFLHVLCLLWAGKLHVAVSIGVYNAGLDRGNSSGAHGSLGEGASVHTAATAAAHQSFTQCSFLIRSLKCNYPNARLAPAAWRIDWQCRSVRQV